VQEHGVDGRALDVRCFSTSAWVRHTYAAAEVDWIAVYDATTERCYYVPSAVWGGLARPRLRLAPTSNGQRRGIRWADEFLVPEHPHFSSERLELLDTLGCPPE